MDHMLLPYRRYFDFEGRSRRQEYWMFVLFQFLLVFGIIIFAAIAGGAAQRESQEPNPVLGLVGILIVIYLLASLIPSLAVQVRRFHDMNMSGWWVLLNLIPYIGGLIVSIMFCFDGTPGPNRFGDDPKGRDPIMPAAFASNPAAITAAPSAMGPTSTSDAIEQLQKLTKLFESGAISKEEFERLKAEILKPRT